MTYAISYEAPQSSWPAVRRVAWYALFAAMLGWSAMVDPDPGVFVEPLPMIGYVSA